MWRERHSAPQSRSSSNHQSWPWWPLPSIFMRPSMILVYQESTLISTWVRSDIWGVYQPCRLWLYAISFPPCSFFTPGRRFSYAASTKAAATTDKGEKKRHSVINKCSILPNTYYIRNITCLVHQEVEAEGERVNNQGLNNWLIV